jgi:hypothetical protein
LLEAIFKWFETSVPLATKSRAGFPDEIMNLAYQSQGSFGKSGIIHPRTSDRCWRQYLSGLKHLYLWQQNHVRGFLMK